MLNNIRIEELLNKDRLFIEDYELDRLRLENEGVYETLVDYIKKVGVDKLSDSDIFHICMYLNILPAEESEELRELLGIRINVLDENKEKEPVSISKENIKVTRTSKVKKINRTNVSCLLVNIFTSIINFA